MEGHKKKGKMEEKLEWLFQLKSSLDNNYILIFMNGVVIRLNINIEYCNGGEKVTTRDKK